MLQAPQQGWALDIERGRTGSAFLQSSRVKGLHQGTKSRTPGSFSVLRGDISPLWLWAMGEVLQAPHTHPGSQPPPQLPGEVGCVDWRGGITFQMECGVCLFPPLCSSPALFTAQMDLSGPGPGLSPTHLSSPAFVPSSTPLTLPPSLSTTKTASVDAYLPSLKLRTHLFHCQLGASAPWATCFPSPRP